MTALRDTDTARRYLLGELPEAEAERFEIEYLDSDGALDELLAAENELIDAHLQGFLSTADEERFARFFLSSPGREERVAFARALHAAASRRRSLPPFERTVATEPMRVQAERVRRGVPAWLGWAAAALLAVPAGVSLVRTRSLTRELAAARDVSAAAAERESHLDNARAELARAQAEIDRLRAAVPPVAPAVRFVVAVLRAGNARDVAAVRTVALPDGTDELRLRLVVPPEPYRSYSVEVETAEGRVVASRSGLPAARFENARAVALTLDARALASGEHVVTVRGVRASGTVETVAEYAFPLKRVPRAVRDGAG
jgi:hypothetical protein